MNRSITRVNPRFPALFIIPLALLTLGAVSSTRFLPASGSNTETYQYPILPATSFNYANITLPDHFLQNGFPVNMPGQNAVIDNDNTPRNNPTTNAGATLGRVLFYERKISANGTVACASCHKQELGFTDNNVKSVGFDGGLTRRHSMGISNARFFEPGKAFWDERADSLEDQALGPIQDSVEMGLTLVELEHIVRHQPYYADLFTAAFGDSEVTPVRIAQAIAQFERSMVSFSSKYDVGRATVESPLDPFPNFTKQENHGKALFMDPQVSQTPITCIDCHMSEAFITPANFAQDPNLTTTSTNVGLDALSTTDFGVMESTGNEMDDFKFKVPSLRNIGVGGPYMHDGRFETLEEVMLFYHNGIQAHPNLDPRLQGPGGQPIRFNLDPLERAALVAFLHTLTDTTLLADEKYSDPFIAATDGEGSKLLDGLVSAGGLADACNSDDIYMELDPFPTTNPVKQKIDLIVIATSPVQNPTCFRFLVESAINGGPGQDVGLTVQLFDYETNRYETRGPFASPESDEFIEIDTPTDPERFVHPINREIQARVTWESTAFSGKPFYWNVDLDTLVWVID